MRLHRSWKIALAMGVILVSGGRAADALAQKQPPAPSTTSQDVPRGKPAQIPVVEPNTQLARGPRIRICQCGNQDARRPLIFVDGEERSHGEGGPPDPGSIESIEVVKGSAAILLYGPRAVDGVILVRTIRL